MKGLSPHTDRLTDGFSPHRYDHEFLDVKIIGRMGAAVDNIHHRDRQSPGGDTTQVPVQRQVICIGCGPGRSHGNA